MVIINKGNLPQILDIWQDTKIKIDLKNQNLDYKLEINIHSGTLDLQEKYQNNLGKIDLEINLFGDDCGVFQECKIAQKSGLFIWKSQITVMGLNCFVKQYNKNFILENTGQISAIPTLKIHTPIVKYAKHGSNSVFLDEEQLWYLQSRGVKDPIKLLIQDFFKK